MDDSVKRKCLVACLVALAIGNMMIQNIASFLPPFVKDHKWVSDDDATLESDDVALILAVFSVA